MEISGLVVATYLVTLVLLALYGFHRSALVFLYYRHRDKHPKPPGTFADLPAVTVQLPLFNEMYVVERLLDSVTAIRYPRDRFHVQVLDDSTDETQEICRRKIAELRRASPDLDIEYLHRVDRSGFKAGALENGLRTAKGEFIAIFDADFLPLPDVLERSVHYFLDPRVAVVQCRWDHLNRDFSPLTEVQALMLDGHFMMEHAGRNRSGRFFNFNGTAGLWRRAAIADAGGWQHDTLTEDMDLSYRAQLRGWRFVYVPEIAAPAELPVEMSSFKSQQFRWAKGSVQVAKKLLPTILRSNATFAQKSEAFFHLTNNLAYPLLLLLSLLLLPNLIFRTHHTWREVLIIDLPLFFGTTLSIASFYLASQREIQLLRNPGVRPRIEWWVIRRLPLVMSLGIGLCVNQTRAVLEALMGRETEFVRTPKHGIRGKLESWSSKKYRAAKSITPFLELGMAAYFAVAIVVAIGNHHYLSMPFLALFLCGFGYVGWVSLWQGGVGLSLRRWARNFLPARSVPVMPPPSFAVIGGASPHTSSIIEVRSEDVSIGYGDRALPPPLPPEATELS
ncbi:MAG TPA: cellulose synthase family protein [Polyangia bacterium]|jgi:cellulose synthase/poly-beta-1,6-N-acetylglucosamine synthase-like glycosyltransferase